MAFPLVLRHRHPHGGGTSAKHTKRLVDTFELEGLRGRWLIFLDVSMASRVIFWDLIRLV